MLQNGCKIVKYHVKRCRVWFYSDDKSLLGLLFSFSCPINKNLRQTYLSNVIGISQKIKFTLRVIQHIFKNPSNYTECIASLPLYDLYIYCTLCIVVKIIIYRTGFVWLFLVEIFSTIHLVQLLYIMYRLRKLILNQPVYLPYSEACYLVYDMYSTYTKCTFSYRTFLSIQNIHTLYEMYSYILFTQ